MLAAPDLGAASLVAFALGGLLALAGCGMIFARRGTPGAALVFLAGAGFLALPWLVAGPPVPPAAAPEPEMAPQGVTLSGDRRRTVATPVPAAPPPPPPGREVARISVEATEAEPNDSLASANVVPLGTVIDGRLEPGDRDCFAVEVPDGMRGDIVANLVVESASLTLTLFDDAGQALGTSSTYSQLAVRTTSVERSLERPRYFVQVQGAGGASGTYQLTIAARPR